METMKDKFTRAGIHAVLTAAGTEIEQARKLTALIIEALSAALAVGKVIELRGLGSLEVRERKTYKAHNPRTMETVDVPPCRRVVFHPGRKLKAVLQNIKREEGL
ncbi:MAG: HU family DNA-binding protein [Treponema sp.]|jgi:nucleoid DNA-binding protein|nr:HU family DNA-binding protein [Treponema sp.]